MGRALLFILVALAVTVPLVSARDLLETKQDTPTTTEVKDICAQTVQANVEVDFGKFNTINIVGSQIGSNLDISCKVAVKVEGGKTVNKTYNIPKDVWKGKKGKKDDKPKEAPKDGENGGGTPTTTEVKDICAQTVQANVDIDFGKFNTINIVGSQIGSNLDISCKVVVKVKGGKTVNKTYNIPKDVWKGKKGKKDDKPKEAPKDGENGGGTPTTTEVKDICAQTVQANVEVDFGEFNTINIVDSQIGSNLDISCKVVVKVKGGKTVNKTYNIPKDVWKGKKGKKD